MRPSCLECLYARIDHVLRSIEVRLANLEMHNVFPCGFQSASANQNFKGSFGSEALHPPRQFQRMCCEAGGHGELAGKRQTAHYSPCLDPAQETPKTQ